jgi:hypothetical protein
MSNDKVSQAPEAELEKPRRREYVAPTVADFFQPVVALGSGTNGCATPRHPKH